jgi:hypothetical protein
MDPQVTRWQGSSSCNGTMKKGKSRQTKAADPLHTLPAVNTTTTPTSTTLRVGASSTSSLSRRWQLSTHTYVLQVCLFVCLCAWTVSMALAQ